MLGVALATIFNSFLDVAATKRLLNYSYLEQMKDIFASVLIGLIMGILVYAFDFLVANTITLILVQISIGAIVFVGLSWITKNEIFMYILNTLKKEVEREACVKFLRA